MSTVLVTGGSGFVGSYCILQLLAAGHQVRTTVRNLKRENDCHPRSRRGAPRRATGCRFSEADLDSDSGWREAARLRVRPSRGFADRRRRAQARGRADRPGARGRAARPARRARSGRQARGADLVVRRRGLRPCGQAAAVRRNRLDQPEHRDRRLCQIQDWRNARHGISSHAKAAARAGRRQSGRRVRPGAGAGFLPIDPPGPAPDGRRRARLPAALFRRRRCARHRRPAPARHDQPAAKGERFLGLAGDFMCDARDRPRPEDRMGAAARRCRRASCRIGWCASPRCSIRRCGRSCRSSARSGTPPATRPAVCSAGRRARDEDAMVATAESLIRLGLLKRGQKRDQPEHAPVVLRTARASTLAVHACAAA